MSPYKHGSMYIVISKKQVLFETSDLTRDIMKKVQEWKTTKNQGHHRFSEEGERTQNYMKSSLESCISSVTKSSMNEILRFKIEA